MVHSTKKLLKQTHFDRFVTAILVLMDDNKVSYSQKLCKSEEKHVVYKTNAHIKFLL